MDAYNKEIIKLFEHLYYKNLILSNLRIVQQGWHVTNSLVVEPMYTDLINWRTKIITGVSTLEIQEFYNEYIGLFDDDFRRFIGWERPNDALELLAFLCKLMKTEISPKDHSYFVIKQNQHIIGIMYLYDYKKKYRKANLTIGLKSEYRGKGIASLIAQSVVQNLMGQGRDKSLLIRLGIEVENTNSKSIAFVEHSLNKLGVVKEGLKKNNYGLDIDCYVYSYTL